MLRPDLLCFVKLLQNFVLLFFFSLTDINLEICCFPRERLCYVLEKDIVSLTSSVPSAAGLNEDVTQGTPLQSFSVPGNPLSLGKPGVRKGCFGKTPREGSLFHLPLLEIPLQPPRSRIKALQFVYSPLLMTLFQQYWLLDVFQQEMHEYGSNI